MKFNANLDVLGRLRARKSPWQENVLDRQVDATLDPGATPTAGDRYLIENSLSLHANFGSITGVGDDDIVEYIGGAFEVVWDASANGEGCKVYVEDENSYYSFDGVAWAADASSSVSALNDLSDVTITSASSAQILVHDGVDSFDNVSVSGDISIGTDGTTAITAGAIVNADVNASAAIAESKLALDFATATLNSGISANTSDIADLRTTQGTADGDTHLGTFTGTTISDNGTVKGALQELETAVESNDTDISNLQGALGASTEAGITYSSTNYVTSGTDTVTAIGALDTQVKANTDALAAVTSPMNYQGNATALVDLADSAAGDYYVVTVQIVSNYTANVGDHLVAKTAVVGTPADLTNFALIDNTEASDIVRTGDTGTVSTTMLANDSVDKTKIAADIAGLGLSQAVGGELDVNVDGSTLEIATDTLQVKDAGITKAKLASGALQRYSTATHSAGTAVTINHALGLTTPSAVHVTMFEVATGEQVMCDSMTFTDGNNLNLNFASSVGANSLRVNITAVE